jgi:hypothetical protein
VCAGERKARRRGSIASRDPQAGLVISTLLPSIDSAELV